MYYGPEKARQMARSILPSTRRKGARESATLLKRATRRNARASLRDWATYTDPWAYEGHIFDYDEPGCGGGGFHEDIKQIMWDRRLGDKLGAFLWWAPVVTAHLDCPEDRYMHIKSMLPNNLIGRHALSHLIHMDEFDCGNPYLYGLGRYNRRYHRTESDPWRIPERVAGVLRELIANGFHADLNRVFLVDGLHAVEDRARELAFTPEDWGAKVAVRALAERLQIWI